MQVGIPACSFPFFQAVNTNNTSLAVTTDSWKNVEHIFPSVTYLATSSQTCSRSFPFQLFVIFHNSTEGHEVVSQKLYGHFLKWRYPQSSSIYRWIFLDHPFMETPYTTRNPFNIQIIQWVKSLAANHATIHPDMTCFLDTATSWGQRLNCEDVMRYYTLYINFGISA